MSEPAPTDGVLQPAPRPSWWREHGCFIWALLPFVAAIPVWLLVFPDSYDRALDFVFDAFSTVLWLNIAAIILRACIRSRKTAGPPAYALVALLFALAALMGWNLTAMYSSAEIRSVPLFGWGWATRPSNLFLVVVGVMLCVGLVIAGVQKLRSRPPQ